MKRMTATEVSRNFSAVLDAVEHGETITITRGNSPVATMGPAVKETGKALREALAAWEGRLDDEFEADVRSAKEMIAEDFRLGTWEES